VGYSAFELVALVAIRDNIIERIYTKASRRTVCLPALFGFVLWMLLLSDIEDAFRLRANGRNQRLKGTILQERKGRTSKDL
jgi:hypothetical protein